MAKALPENRDPYIFFIFSLADFKSLSLICIYDCRPGKYIKKISTGRQFLCYTNILDGN